MKRSVLVLSVLAGLAATPAASWAADASKGVAAAFGNTVRTTYPDGRHQHFWLKSDGRWEGVGRRGNPSSGTWKVKGEQICFKQTKPFPAPFDYCTDFPREADVGVEWTSRDVSGTPIRLTLVKGLDR